MLEAIENHIESPLELVSVVVSGLHGVLGDERGQVGELIDGERLSILCANSAISAVFSNGRFIWVIANP